MENRNSNNKVEKIKIETETAQKRIEELEERCKQLEKKCSAAEQQVYWLNDRLNLIYDSDMYKLSLKYYKIRDKILPENSTRFNFMKRVVRKIKRILGMDRHPAAAYQGTQMDLLHGMGKYKRMDIVTTKHTMYVAQLVKKQLDRIAVECEIHIGEPEEYQDIPYLIICPQFVKRFPKVYFAFQMEQTISSRWFTDEYLTILRNSCGVLDYSLKNVEFFQGIEYRDLTSIVYYLPIDYYQEFTAAEIPQKKEYDVVFYGDASNERRKMMLAELSKRFKVKVCRELYGEDVYREIRKAKVLINIHYYENAMLETTRLFEALSLNSCVIVSEDSRYTSETDRLSDYVDFVPVDDMQKLIERVAYWVEHDQEREEKIKENRKGLEQRANAFDFYFYRFLMAHDRITFDEFYALAGDYVQLNTNRICLSLPESTERRKSFDADNLYGFECFPGLRHEKGWVGCGLSYKMIFKKAKEAGMKNVMICEDDVIFPADFAKRLNEILEYLEEKRDWSVFSGVMADVGEVKVVGCEKQGAAAMIKIDQMISMVFNIYNQEMFDIFSKWDEQNRDVTVNAIDRYLQGKKLSIYVQTPFLVGHKEELNSTIWGFNNSQYADMIANSEKKLIELADKYMNTKE